MTFHAGNGVTLTKEEENLPEEEKQRLIRQREEQINYERHADDDLKEMAERGDMAGLEAEEKRLDKKLGAARIGGLGGADIDHDAAMMAAQELENERLRKQGEIIDEFTGKGATASGGSAKGGRTAKAKGPVSTELGTGAFGTLKNEDFTQYRKDKAARMAAAAEARRSANDAMAAKRRELLASGEYFDNGRGQILRKKQFRQYVAGDRRHMHLRTAADNGAGMAVIRGAGIDAWQAALDRQGETSTDNAVNYSRSAVQANRLAAEERKAAKAEAAATSAKAKLSVFDGFAAALDALNADAANAEDNVVSVWGGKDEKGRDARWTYDEQGRITGQADPRQVVRGKKLASGGVQQTEGNFRKGFVDPVVLKAINSQLQKRGADYAVTGIMAKQAYGAIGKPVEGSKPMFYIQGLRNDGTQFGQYMTIDDVYRWGVENYRAANGENGDARQFAIEALGGYDPEGLRKGNGDNWHENVARINAGAKVKAAEIAAGAKTDTAKIYSDGKIGVANANNKAMLEKTRMQIASYAEKNASQERIAQSKADAAKWIEGLRSKTALSKTQMDNDAKTNIATIKTEAEKATAEGKLDAYMYGKELDYDAKIEAVKASNMRDAAKNAVIERIAAEKNAAMLTMAEMKNAVTEDNIDLGWFKAETAADQGQQKLDNDKAAKDADREMRLVIEEIREYGRNGASKGGSVSKSDLKRAQEIQKTIDGGNLTGENRTRLKNELNEIVSKYRPEEAVNLDNQAHIKPGDNTGDETKDANYWRSHRDEFAKLPPDEQKKVLELLRASKK